MKLVVMRIVLEMCYCLLPVGHEYVAIVAVQALVDLLLSRQSQNSARFRFNPEHSHLPKSLDIDLSLEHRLGLRAVVAVSDTVESEHVHRIRGKRQVTYSSTCACVVVPH